MLMIMLSRRRIFDDGEAEGDDGCGVPRNLVLDLSVNYANVKLKSRPGYIAKGRPVFAEYLIKNIVILKPSASMLENSSSQPT